jgi:transcription antitermination protein NusB
MHVLTKGQVNMKGSRRKARILALQALYEVDAAHHEPGIVVTWLLENEKMSDENIQFVRELVDGVLSNIQTIDSYIKQYAPAWPVEQLPIVDRNIMRIAIFEILLDGQTPVKVAIDEAVELAKSFGSNNSFKFINGVLGSVSLLTAKK